MAIEAKEIAMGIVALAIGVTMGLTVFPMITSAIESANLSGSQAVLGGFISTLFLFVIALFMVKQI